ncbi:MAG: DUF167 domain-containing protein [Candidatus Falkowbacteria bacterium]
MWQDVLTQLKIKGEAYLAVKVIPGSAKTEFRELMENDVYKIAVAAAPEKGKANAELIKFLAKELQVSKNRFKIIAGAGEKTKLIKILK